MLEVLILDPFDPSLSTHALRGKLFGYFACSVDPAYRIIMRISKTKQEIILLDIGNHEIYRRYGQ